MPAILPAPRTPDRTSPRRPPVGALRRARVRRRIRRARREHGTLRHGQRRQRRARAATPRTGRPAARPRSGPTWAVKPAVVTTPSRCTVGPAAQHPEERVVAQRAADRVHGRDRRARRAGRRTSACGPGRPAADPAAARPAAGARRRPVAARVRPPERSDHSHSAYFANPSFSQMCRQSAMDTLLPNHWCASSCATSRSEPRAPSTWLAPNSDNPCASTGTSSSSSVTTTAYSPNGYGPNSSSNSSIMAGCRAKSRENSVQQVRRDVPVLRHAAEARVAEQHRLVLADGQPDQIAGRRRGLLVHPGRRATPSSSG